MPEPACPHTVYRAAHPQVYLHDGVHKSEHRIQEQTRTIPNALVYIAYFIFGIGVGVYFSLYKDEVGSHHVNFYIFGVLLNVNYLVAALFFPVACLAVTSVSCKQSTCTALIVVGVCQVLQGLLQRVPSQFSFFLLSGGIQIVDGLGTSILIAATFLALPPRNSLHNAKQIGYNLLLPILELGVSVGCIGCKGLTEFSKNEVPFYGAGCLAVLHAVIILIFFREPDTTLRWGDFPLLSWAKNKIMWIYFLIIFSTLAYAGFTTVVIVPYLRQFHLRKILVGSLMCLPFFSAAMSSLCFTWIIRKGVNSVLLVCFSSILIGASLILLGPAPFTSLELSLTNASVALVLQGLGSGGKLSCALNAAERDARTRRRHDENFDPFIVPVVSTFASLTGLFFGSVTAGVTWMYLGVVIASYILLGFEVIVFGTSLIYAFKRNYRSLRHVELRSESHSILAQE